MITLVDGSDWEPSHAQLQQWAKAFPAVDVERELEAMESWGMANPKKRKTRSGVARFVNSWLSRSQDRGGASPYSQPSATLRGRKISSDLVDVSWVPSGWDRYSASIFFLNKYGCYFDGQQMRTEPPSPCPPAQASLI